jgi:signal-transduction protein with cAMP-binding, CBS, and nucleotidyltransferase domain
MRKLGDVTLEPRPITLNQAASVTEDCDRVRDREAGAAVLVIDNSERLVGISTGRDAVCRVLAQRRDAAATALTAAMIPNP